MKVLPTDPESVGWWLALPYMKGRGFRLVDDSPLPDHAAGADYIFLDDKLLSTRRPQDHVAQSWAALRHGGILVVYLPVSEDDRGIAAAVQALEPWNTLFERTLEREDGHSWNLVVASKGIGAMGLGSDDSLPSNAKADGPTCLVLRYGGYGDVLLASTVLPELAGQGYRITVGTNARGFETLRHDPHIHDFIILHDGQVADDHLAYYWAAHAIRYNRVVNLQASLEGAILYRPQDVAFLYDDATRRRMASRSYAAFVGEIADVEPAPVTFYATDAEKAQAASFKGQGRLVAIAMRGSSHHKVWPHMDHFIVQLLAATEPDVRIALLHNAKAAGEVDMASAIGQAVSTWSAAKSRFFVINGSLRQSLALACAADVVVGPETGVMHAVSGLPSRKVCLLSHSSARNLTQGWENTVAIEPDVPCHPCHRLHRIPGFCQLSSKHQTIARCAEAILPSDVLPHVVSHLETVARESVPARVAQTHGEAA